MKQLGSLHDRCSRQRHHSNFTCSFGVKSTGPTCTVGLWSIIPWEIGKEGQGLRKIKEENHIFFLLWEPQQHCACLSATGYVNINLLCEADRASSHWCWTVRARWVCWINMYGSMTGPGVWEFRVGGNKAKKIISLAFPVKYKAI